MEYSGTCLIRLTRVTGKYVRLYRMSEYSGLILVNRNTLGQYIFVGCHRMSDYSGVGLYRFHCINIKRNINNEFCFVLAQSHILHS